MNLEKLLKVALDYLSEYFHVFVETLKRPTIRFAALQTTTEESSSIITLSQEGALDYGSRLNPRLFVFVLISIFIGSTINSLIPGREKGPDFAIKAVVVLAVWFFYSLLIYSACKLFVSFRQA